DTLEKDYIVEALTRLALSPAAWDLVRTNYERSMAGPAAQTAVTESTLPVADLGSLPLNEFPVEGDKQVATTAMGALVA
ncbi:hypothetical protein, partial [Haemophilus parainfluenzae]|uniref:hypothetical protein n=1 Tax=Haemophilus parainfluenzae TaxID=729 RepID=UPI00157F03A9